ncbi:MAG: hypothetical protein ABUL62_27255 [Myxococcales bacterium]
MTSQPEQLADALIWDDQGHLAEVAVTALADGELSLLPAPAVAHAESCAVCADRIGSSALLSLALSDALSRTVLAPEPQETPQRIFATRQPLPLGWLAVALLVAALGSLPSLARLWGLLFHLPELAAHALPVLARVAVLVGRGLTDNQALVELRWLSVATLSCVGIAIARLGPHGFRRPLEKGAS